MSGLARDDARSALRLGMVGAGFIAQVTHLNALAELPGCAVVAIADDRAELRQEVARRYGVGLQCDDPGEVLSNPDIDAFIVAMPRRAMSAIVESALGTGKPVLAEKPIAHTLAQGRRLVGAAEKSGSRFAVGYMKRHDPGVTLFREVLSGLRASGDLGEIVHVAMRDYCATYATPIPFHVRSATPRPVRYTEWPTAPDWLPQEQREDYEVTLNVASHDVNLLRYLIGDGIRARTFRVRSKGIQLAGLEAEKFDIALELGRVDTGRWEQTIDIYFRRGLLRLLLPSPLARQETAQVVMVRGGSTETTSPPPDRRVWAFKAQAAQFLDVVRGAAEPLASGRDALADLAITEDLWKLAVWSS